MSYDCVETDSLITLEYALYAAIKMLELIKDRESGAEQMLKNLKYELSRIKFILKHDFDI